MIKCCMKKMKLISGIVCIIDRRAVTCISTAVSVSISTFKYKNSVSMGMCRISYLLPDHLIWPARHLSETFVLFLH